MLFNSYVFLFALLPVALCGFFVLGQIGRSYAASWLVLVSLVFYAYWSPIFLVILLVSVLFNYGMSELIAARAQQPVWQSWLLGLVVAGNLSALAYCQYLFVLFAFPAHEWAGRCAFRSGRAAARHLLLHLHPNRVSHRYEARRDEESWLSQLPFVCDLLPASDRRTNSPQPGNDAAIRRSRDVSFQWHEPRGWQYDLHYRPVEEMRSRRSDGIGRDRGIFAHGYFAFYWCMACRTGVFASALF